MFDNQKITCAAPVGLTDEALAEALTGRFEADTWENMGKFLGEVFLRISTTRQEPLENLLANLPTVVEQLCDVPQHYRDTMYGDSE